MNESILSTRKVDINFNPGSEPIVLRIEGKNIGSLKNFIGLTGLPKNGKGKYAGGMIASALSRDEVFGMRLRLPESRQRIGWFATDESEHDLFKSIQLVKSLSRSNCNGLDIFNVRRDGSSEIRQGITEYLNIYTDCSMILIDNIGDLLINYNDEGQSKRLINDMKRWTDQHNILIVAILHLGKGNNTTLGHLGAGLDRYAQSILRVERDKEKNCYTLTGNMLRSAAEFTPIDIMFDPGSDTWKQIYHDPTPATKLKPIIARPQELNNQEHRANLIRIFNSKEVQKYDLLLSNIKLFYERGSAWGKDCIKHLTQSQIIIQDDDGFRLSNPGQTKLSLV